jgi:O-acetyl-ADP-ribose deacetylase (regulator of RNase III)
MAIDIILGRIETLAVAAIVNAANSALNGGAGVDGAIRAAAGPALEAYLAARAPLEEGAALLSPGFEAPARWIIHTVAPKWFDPGSDERKDALLAACYRACLNTARDAGLDRVAFPALGTGVYGWPKPRAAAIAVAAIRAAQEDIAVTLCAFTAQDADILRAALAQAAA